MIHAHSSAPEWWRSAVIYQIYPRSFATSAGPVGDLAGITSRLPKLRELGVDAVWLSPFYKSPQNDAGYDVADYRDIDPRFGTLADADTMVQRAHELGLRIFIDLVPNHSSDEHEWFQAALAAGPGSAERDRYWFRPSEEIPNNWTSIFGGPAWSRVRDRADALGSPWEDDDSWYLHLFDVSQPDLNWDNPDVRAEFRSILRFWLDRGVDGFRVDVAHGLVKDPTIPDWDGEMNMVDGGTEEAVRPPMFDQDGLHEIYRDWRSVLGEYDGDRALVAEAWVDPVERLALYVREDEMHQAFNFDFLVTQWDAKALRDVIAHSYRANDAVGAPTTWVLSNHDVVRHVSRMAYTPTQRFSEGLGPNHPEPDLELGLARARAATMLMLALPGSAYLYQGEELGLPEVADVPDELREDPAFFKMPAGHVGRDGCRVPIPWEADAPGFGFSPDGESWLPQPADWNRLARDAQEGVEGSTLEMYRSALVLRRERDLGNAGLRDGDLATDGVIHYVSELPGRDGMHILTTISAESVLPAGAAVLLASGEIGDDGSVPVNRTVWFTLG